MIPLNAPELGRIASLLAEYDPKSTLALTAGLLTEPTLHANTIRIETLAHLAVAHCQGIRQPGPGAFRGWINRELGSTQFALLEDPVEDVFVGNVQTPEGNRRVFEGIWEFNDYFAQEVLDTLAGSGVPQECRGLLGPCYALLRISESVADRANLRRWHTEESVPQGAVKLPPRARMADRARCVTFTYKDLDALGLDCEVLAPFILREEDRQALGNEMTGESSLERRPIVDFGGELVLALPHAVSPAIRRFAISELAQMGCLSAFGKALAKRQAHEVQRECLAELRGTAEFLPSPRPDGRVPALHSWLLRHDVDKVLHVVLLHDQVDLLNREGLSSFMRYPENLREGLEKYLCQVSSHCQSLGGVAEGTTLLVMGGLGRGFSLGFRSVPDRWRLSILKLPDLLMLARELHGPILRYLKFIKQKEWAEERGVKFYDLNGDYNLYCYWRNQGYRLVPRDIPLDASSVLVTASNMVLPVRQELRTSVDPHVVIGPDGQFFPVMRLGRDALFRSMQNRPIYASLQHLYSGLLAGVVETPRGPSWLMVESGTAQSKGMLYDVWSGFISLYDKLVFEVEGLYPQSLTGPIEVHLDFTRVKIPTNFEQLNPDLAPGQPELSADLCRRAAHVGLPADFFAHFLQTDNVGERLLVRAIADGLVHLHENVTCGVDEAIVDRLVDNVISFPGARVVHLFPARHPVEVLLECVQNPVFVAQEDFAFAKLGLSEGCVRPGSGLKIESKDDCNEFLHKVVDKLWGRLRTVLRQLDRASVLRKVLGVYEAAIHDREHWHRTAQAVLCLYGPKEDVLSVAQEREASRASVSVAARTILEMAICECPEEAGRELSRNELDELLARAALLVEVATDSDAIYSGLIEPQIVLHPNGEYMLNRIFHKTVLLPFLAAYHHEEFELAARDYGRFYDQTRSAGLRAEDVFPSGFVPAFRTEFGLTPDEAVDGLGALMDLAVKLDEAVVETTLGSLKASLTASSRLSPEAADAFLRTFCIFHRPAWESPPPGFQSKDINPWRFRRRLSVTTRPILAFGQQDKDKVLFGVGGLRLGIAYVIERSAEGHLPQEFFASREMRQYAGKASNLKGHEFALWVADQFRQKGWEARTGVPVSELGGPSELGDVDVLAWTASQEVKLIECKRLQLARTVAEIAEVCRRFRGESKDELGRHVRRVNWIRQNPSSLRQVVGFVPDRARIDDRLVTNTHVPMTYLNDLPLRPEKIGPIGEKPEVSGTPAV